jgi:uncharacterized protein YkwD
MPHILRFACIFALLLTAANAQAGSSLEEGIVQEMSLARSNPQAYAGFIRAFRARYRDNYYTLPGAENTHIITQEGLPAVDEALHFLEKQQPVPQLTWSDGLALAAADLAREQGKNGATGHVGKQSGDMKTRIERHGHWLITIGENIAYGPDQARLVVMQLIIDDGVKNRGHRSNIYKPAFTTAGAGCGPHPGFRTVCVIDYAGGFSD